jgi:hypothetical protein
MITNNSDHDGRKEKDICKYKGGRITINQTGKLDERGLGKKQ